MRTIIAEYIVNFKKDSVIYLCVTKGIKHMFIASNNFKYARRGRVLPGFALACAGVSLYYPVAFIAVLLVFGFTFIHEWFEVVSKRFLPLIHALGAVGILAALTGIVLTYGSDPYGYGRNMIIHLVFLTSCADMGALLFGKYLQGPRLWSEASPNKTWTGVVGALLSTIACGFALTLLPREFSVPLFENSWTIILVCLVVTSCAVTGDLLFSRLKRVFNVKDFGSSLGAHGGFLDRFDSYMLTSIVLLFLHLEY